MTSPIRGVHLQGRWSESASLDRLVAAARAGHGQVLVLRGEAGIGKTALLRYVEAHASDCRVVSVTGAAAETELAYAGLHQLCMPFADRIERLPGPQREALVAALGVGPRERAELFPVALGVLSLLAGVAREEPLVCVVDDAQWLDRPTLQTLAFVARRVGTDAIALVIATGGGADVDELTALPVLDVHGLDDIAADRLLDTVLIGRVDERVRRRMIAECHGNPAALLALPETWTPAEAIDGLHQAALAQSSGAADESVRRRIDDLPADSRRLLQVAAAEPLGDAAWLWRAARVMRLAPDAALPAQAAELVDVGVRVHFRNPSIRAAAYRGAAPAERHAAHRVLACTAASDVDPARLAWHRALSAPSPEEARAAEAERCAGVVLSSGLTAAAALLERAAVLTPDATRRAERELAAASAMRDIGAGDEAMRLLMSAESGPFDPARQARSERMRGLIAFDRHRPADAGRLLLNAAKRLHFVDADLARTAHLEALAAALWASGASTSDAAREAADAARSAPPTAGSPRAVDVLLDALATRVLDGYAAAAPLLTRAVDALKELGARDDRNGVHVLDLIAADAWDFAAEYSLAERQVQLARELGTPAALQLALDAWAKAQLLAGELPAAGELIDESRRVTRITGVPAVGDSAVLLAALRGDEHDTLDLAATAARDAGSLGGHRSATFADYATAVLYNGLGRHDLAREAALRVFEGDVVGTPNLVIAELAEAASRTGDRPLIIRALARVAERADATPTCFAEATQARLQALASSGRDAERHYRRSIELLRGSGIRVELARGHLLLGEWLRREGRRVDARGQLRTAHDALTVMGVDGFAERATRELLATGERVRRRGFVAGEPLTAQEVQIVRLARDGLSNPEIGTRLFLSPRTVEWHLRKVFAKLGISSRRQLRDAGPDVASA